MSVRLLRHLLLLFISFASITAFAQPPENNDEPCSAVAFPTGGSCGEDVQISTVGATTSPVAFPPPNTCNPGLTSADLPFNDIWYTANADAFGNLSLEAIVGPDDPVIAAYSSSDNTCTGTFTLLGCDDDGGPGLDANLNLTGLTPGQPVWIRVWAYAFGGVATNGTFIISATNGGTPPANDNCASAVTASAGVTESGTTNCATLGAGDPTGGSCAITTDNSVWYTFTPGTSGSYNVDFSNLSCVGVNNDLQLFIMTGACGGPFTEVACNSSVASTTTFSGTAGTTYYLMVDGLNGATCDFDMLITQGCAYGNDDCTTAESFPGIVGNDAQVCITNECNDGLSDPGINTGMSACGDIAGPTLWYTVTTDPGDELLDITVTSGDFDPHIVVWTTCGPPATYFSDAEYCAVSNPGAGTATISQATITGSTTYYITVSPSAGIGSGDFDICATSYPNPCTPSDDCATATSFGTPPSATTTCLTNECNIGANDLTTGSPSCGTIQGELVYYTLTMNPGDDLVDITVNSTDIADPMIVIWDACGTFFVNECAVGSGGSVSYTYDPGAAGPNVLFSISSASGSNTGNFDVCVNPYPNNAACNVDNDLYINSSSSPPDANGNYLPGTTIEFCYEQLQYNQTNINFLHGVVPTVGSGYDPATIVATSTPAPQGNNETGSYWDWEPGGTVNYNPLGGLGKYPDGYLIPDAGWWFHSIQSGNPPPTDPNNSWGDGCNTAIVTAPSNFACVGSGGIWLGGPTNNCLLPCVGDPATGFGMQWTFCFEVTTDAVYDCTSPMDFSVAVETFADGETGTWTDLGCAVDGPVVLNVPAPTPAPIFITVVSSTDPSCNGDSDGIIQVSATGGYGALQYSINGGPYGALTTFTGLPAATHTISVIDEIGCVQTLDVPLTDPAIPAPPTIGFNTPLCVGDDLNLTATAGGGVTATNFSWSGPNGFTSTLQNPTITNITTANSGTYSISADINGCPSSTGTLDITVRPNPSASIIPDPASVCDGSSITLDGNPSGGTGTYVVHDWTGAGSGNLDDPAIQTPDFTGAGTGTFALTYTVTDDYGCSGTDNITVTVHPQPDVDPLSDQTVCDSYTLPAITGTNLSGNEAYYTGPGGTGTQLNPGNTITTAGANTIYIYDETGTTPNCFDEESFVVTVNLTPNITNPGNQTACDSYTLPAIAGTNLTGGESYYTGPGGTGTALNPGDAITTPGANTLYIYDETGTAPNCSDDVSFTVTINVTPTVDNPGDQTACDTYTLPAITGTNLTGNEAYFTGTGGTGTQLNPGDAITTAGVNTLYVYDETGTTPNCSDEETFTVTINLTPAITNPGDQTACDSYTLPAITGTDLSGSESYYTGPGGTGTALNPGDAITTPGVNTIYIYDETGTAPNCSDEVSFDVTINISPAIINPGDQTACDTYSLPAISGTNLSGSESYYTGPGGTGTALNPGDAITTPGVNTIYIYDETGTTPNCADEVSFDVTITTTPVVTNPGDQTACDSYALPAITGTDLSGSESYYTGPGGTGTALNPGDAITTPGVNTIYIYDETGTTPNCSDEVSFDVTINVSPTFTLIFTDPSGCGASDGSITIQGLTPSATYDITYSDGGTPVNLTGQTANGSGEISITGLDAGSYSTFTVDDGNCVGNVAGPVVLTDPSSSVFTLSFTDPTSCGGTDGTITISGLNPSTSYDISYDDGATTINLGSVTTNASGDYVITGLDAGTYSGFVAVLAGCTGTNNGPITLSDPAAPAAPIAGSDATYCDGDAIADLTATPGSGGTINWYDDAGLTNNVGSGSPFSPSTAVGTVTYYATETVVGCESPGTPVTITIDPTPTAPTAGTNATYCDGDVIADMTATAGSGGTLDWYDDAGLTNNVGTGTTVTPANTIGTTVYYVTETLGACTSAPSTVTITIDPTPTFTIGTTLDPTSCGGTDGSIQLTGLDPSTSYDVSYDDGSGTVNLGSITTDASGNYIIPGLGADTYSNITVTLGSCSDIQGPVTLTDPGSPTFTVAGSDPTICGGTDGFITISGLNPSTTYDVSYNDGGIVNLPGVTANGAGEYVITGLGAGSYSNFTVTIAGCTGSDPGPVVLNDPAAPAAPTAGTDATYCDGDAIADLTATAGAGGTINWYDDAGLTNNVGTGSPFTPSTAVGTVTYYATETVAGCESAGTPVTITINPTPVAPTAGTDATYCDGDVLADMTATAGSGGTLEWYDDAGLTNNVGTGTAVTPANTIGTTVYYVTETLGSCTSAPSTVTITIDPSPTFAIGTTSDPSSCGATDGSIELTGLDPSTSYDVSYDDGTGTVNLGTITTDASGNYVITGLGADTYSNITVTLGNCSVVQGPVTLTDPGAPTFTVSGTDPTTCGGTDGSITISGLTPSTSYDISYDDGGTTVNLGTVTTDASGNYIITGLPAGSYDNFIVNLLGCANTDPGVITLSDPGAPAAPVAGTDATYCEGDVIADLTATPGAGGTINWYDDAGLTNNVGTGTTLSPATIAGTYTYYATETVANCESAPTLVTITINIVPAAPTAGADASYCLGDTPVDMTGTPSNGGTINWYDDAGLSNLLSTGNSFAPANIVGTTTYYVTEELNGCESPASSVIITFQDCDTLALEIPTGFTPDGDGVNDLWVIENLTVLFPNNKVLVYNRWGNPIFESDGYQNPWDGTYNGTQLPVGSYYFIIEFNDGQREPETGTVTIITR